eukprot:TRINITY_DN46492_c0_g1_i1.p2 TRINITY_DN46492_c0_g1~~TRINITY_DN46492_c0_g1_i1.p2  ORF type:complete len:306 (+),score=32.61 TRINITY_DN46492_c0_g1_i1:60-977(+)
MQDSIGAPQQPKLTSPFGRRGRKALPQSDVAPKVSLSSAVSKTMLPFLNPEHVRGKDGVPTGIDPTLETARQWRPKKTGKSSPRKFQAPPIECNSYFQSTSSDYGSFQNITEEEVDADGTKKKVFKPNIGSIAIGGAAALPYPIEPRPEIKRAPRPPQGERRGKRGQASMRPLPPSSINNITTSTLLATELVKPIDIQTRYYNYLNPDNPMVHAYFQDYAALNQPGGRLPANVLPRRAHPPAAGVQKNPAPRRNVGQAGDEKDKQKPPEAKDTANGSYTAPKLSNQYFSLQRQLVVLHPDEHRYR